MKIKDITEPGFYLTYNPDIMYEVFENTDEVWLAEEPEAKLIVDEWNRKIDSFGIDTEWYESTGALYSLYYDLADLDVYKTCRHYQLVGHGGCYLRAIPLIMTFYE